ncbi:hypothetical protein AVEN_130343-1 [Araneus ventricosus]|uniref:DUF4817 domain-containing protein n=1 Tax=Araneus ventricosus TaxID=182803 RepID=A0A4Y2BDV2_ARAVE|nr:hypothetical protein AVEN_130343-1 [Araneus ventricosus]
MPLTKEERIDIILLAWGGTTHHVAPTFNATHRMQITHNTAKTYQGIQRADSVAGASRSGKPKKTTDLIYFLFTTHPGPAYPRGCKAFHRPEGKHKTKEMNYIKKRIYKEPQGVSRTILKSSFTTITQEKG